MMRFSQTMLNTISRYTKSETLTNTDRFYAQLIHETYPNGSQRKTQVITNLGSSTGTWIRQKRLDSKFISVWDHVGSNKRFVAVRGTKMDSDGDLRQDLKIAFSGEIDNLIGDDLRKIQADSIANGKVVERGGHSLGVSLLLRAYDEHPHLFGTYSPVIKTYQYNPPYCPTWFLRGTPAVTCLSKKFEATPNMRWFINLYDLVSIGGGHGTGPRETVYFNAADAGVPGWELNLENGVAVVKRAAVIMDEVINGQGQQQQLSKTASKFLAVHKLSQWINGKPQSHAVVY